MNTSQFDLDMSERIHMFGADASPFFSFSSAFRKTPAFETMFSWMEDELFVKRDIKAKLKVVYRDISGGTNEGYVHTIKLLNGSDWQVFEATPLADSITCSTQNAGVGITAIGHTPFYCTITVGSNTVKFFPSAYGLSKAPGKRTYTTSGSQSLTLINELVLNDHDNGGASAGTSYPGGYATDNYGKECFQYDNSTNAIAVAGMHTLYGSTPTASGEVDCTIHAYTPNEIYKGFAQGSGLPGESRKRTRTKQGYVQIFKTPYSIANTLKKVRLVGGDELSKLRYRKAIQHKIDIERAFLFQGGGTLGTDWGVISGSYENPLTRLKGLGVGVTDPAKAGYIETKNGGWDSAYQFNYSTATMSDLNALTGRIFEDTVDNPSSTKVCFASRKWLGALSEMPLKANTDSSGYGTGMYRWGNINQRDGALGVSVRTLESPYGILHFVDMPHFRGQYENYALVVDFENIEVRPLRDTTLFADAGGRTIDGQLDYYMTEIGFEARHESTHAVLKLGS